MLSPPAGVSTPPPSFVLSTNLFPEGILCLICHDTNEVLRSIDLSISLWGTPLMNGLEQNFILGFIAQYEVKLGSLTTFQSTSLFVY